MKSRVWMGLIFCVAASCGQELELPIEPPAGSVDAGASSSGITGLAGAPEDSVPARLPVSETPLFAEGGAGGAAESGGAGAANIPNGAGAGNGSRGGDGNRGGNGNGNGGDNGNGNGGDNGNGGGSGNPPSLMFTEYIEGSGSLKALEIFAISGGSLEGCELRTYFNGKLVPGKLALHGELAAGQTQVLCSSVLATAQPALCTRSTSLTFNGDDALALACAGELLDVVGQLGVDPGESWGQGATADHTLRRRCEVTSGRVDGTMPFDPALEWTSFAVDTFADLGNRGCP